MYVRIPLLVAVAALALAACGGDDTSTASQTSTNDESGTTDESGAPDTTSASPDGESTSAATEPAGSQACEDIPDPADYSDEGVPQALRPCAIPTDLVVNTIREGSGPEAAAGDTIIVEYVGIRSADGSEFDSSYPRGVPFDFLIGRGSVIQGWDEGLTGTQAGELLKIDIPAEMAYGDTPPPGDVIESGDALTFVVDVQAVIPAVTTDDAPVDIDIPVSVGATEVTMTDAVDGEGDTIELGDTAVIHLMLIRGDNQVVLFNTWDDGDPLQVVMEEGATIPGIFDGLQGMAVGGQRVIVMPPDDAFGAAGQGNIGLPADTDLVAVVEVVGVY